MSDGSLRWTHNAPMLVPPPKPSTPRSSSTNADGDICLLEQSVSSSYPSSTDESLALPWTEPEELPLSTPIHKADVITASSSDIPITHTSPDSPAIVLPGALIGPVVQKVQSPRPCAPPTSDSRHSSPLHFPHSKLYTTPLPYSPHCPAHTNPNTPSPPRGSISYQARKNTRLMSRHEVSRSCPPSIFGMLRSLFTLVCKLTKDGDFLLLVHKGLQALNEDHLYREAMNEHLPLFKQIVQNSNHFLTVFQNGPTRSNMQADFVSQCEDDLNSIVLNAEASIAVIIGFLARSGHAISSGSSIS